MVTLIAPEWFVWLIFGMMCISIFLQVVLVVLRFKRLQIARATKSIADEVIEQYGQL